MANPEHVEILLQGHLVVREWHESHKNEHLDLEGANLEDAILTSTDLRKANLRSANLQGARLRSVNLTGADLTNVYLSDANLMDARLNEQNLVRLKCHGSYLYRTRLHKADLREAFLGGSILVGADLREADLRGARLNQVDLTGAHLTEAKFSGAQCDRTVFANVDLSTCHGLEEIIHNGPSSVGVDTISLSKGKISEEFLRGCGLSDWEIESAKLYNPHITNQDMTDVLYRVHEIRAKQPIQISNPFISHSHKDNGFVARLEKSLKDKGIRYWLDYKHSTSGPLEEQIDRAISQNPIVLVILSENSIKSDWVQHEVRRAREVEIQTGQNILCPVRLDDSFFSSPWPERIKEQVMEYNILDFSEWENDEKFEKMFTRLIDGLNLFYKKKEEE